MYKYIIEVNLIKQYLRYLINLFVAVVTVFVYYSFDIPKPSNYLEWIAYAIPSTIIVGIIIISVNCMLFREDCKSLIPYIKKIVRK